MISASNNASVGILPLVFLLLLLISSTATATATATVASTSTLTSGSNSNSHSNNNMFRLSRSSHVSKAAAFISSPSSSTRQQHMALRSLASKSRKISPYTVEDVQGNTISASEEVSGFRRPVVQWYPGHIAKAERMLKESFLKAVDVVIEVRDARIPKATAHPKVAEWCAGRPRIVVLTHIDAIPKSAQLAWLKAYSDLGAEHYSVNDEKNKIDAQILHQARQAAQEREKYRSVVAADQTTTNNKDSKKKQPLDKVDAANNIQSAAPVQHVVFVNAKEGGSTILDLKRAIHKAGQHIQERRARRGLKERALRVGILGYPNVGKSALINRLLNRKRARSYNTPGVTRSLQWIRIRTDDITDRNGRASGKSGAEFELLDSPGIIPMSFLKEGANPEEAQSDALLLAACNCIGDQAYDNQEVAAYLSEWLLAMHRLGYGNSAPQWPKMVKERYKFDPLKDKNVVLLNRFPEFQKFDEDGDMTPPPTHRTRTGQDVLDDVAANTCQGDPEDAARKVLQDFRAGRLGPICLQVAPATKLDHGQSAVLAPGREQIQRITANRQAEYERQQQRATAAREAAAELGLELPPVALAAAAAADQQHEHDDSKKNDGTSNTNDIGKGLFDGW